MLGQGLRRIVIVGGGTAGWMTAAALRHFFSDATEIQLIESADVGVIGVGEATVPYIRYFNDELGIDEREMVRRTHATFKLGIDFKDWRAEGVSFFHGFGDFGPSQRRVSTVQQWLRLRALGDKTDLGAYSFVTAMALANRFTPPGPDPRGLLSNFNYAFHFDAALYAELLRELAEQQGVKRTEGRIVDVVLKGENGFIESVQLESGDLISGDVFIDCSGFAALLIEGALKSGFEDFSHWLPVDRAWAVPCASSGEPEPYTRSTARTAGWQWRIPLQHRMGNGHVFSSAFMGEDAAGDILMQSLEGEALASPRLLKFKTGRRKKFWNKNCIAIGLASGFLEPLESTSISLIQNSIGHFLELAPDLTFDPRLIAEYNRLEALQFDRVRDFIILHYCLSQRQDGELWRYCRDMPLPETLAHKIEVYRASGRTALYDEESFLTASWDSIFIGMGVYPTRENPFADRQSVTDTAKHMLARRSQIRQLVDSLPTHAQFIARNCSIDPLDAVHLQQKHM